MYCTSGDTRTNFSGSIRDMMKKELLKTLLIITISAIHGPYK